MIKKTFLLFIIILSVVISCNHVYKKYDKESFPAYIWTSGQTISFNPKIKDVTKTYKLILGIRHLYGVQYKNINVTVKTITPTGDMTSKSYELEIMDSENKYMGKCGGDLCDLEKIIENKIKFTEPGEYKYTVTQNTQTALPGVMEFGLLIDEIK